MGDCDIFHAKEHKSGAKNGMRQITMTAENVVLIFWVMTDSSRNRNHDTKTGAESASECIKFSLANIKNSTKIIFAIFSVHTISKCYCIENVSQRKLDL